jgi:glyoxylase-like metal-dependent hydrolase (beta-lactamase superfamily II)
MKLSRRAALTGAATLPIAATLGRPARAAAEMKGPTQASVNRFALGGFEVTALLAGSRKVEEPQTIFGLDVPAEDFAAVSQAHFLPVDAAQFYFTPTLVNTGSELILFDTGLAPEGIVAALAAAGHAPEDIDTVVITHMHGDHIGGLAGDAGPTFANARLIAGQVEFDHWRGAGNETFDARVAPLADRFGLLGDGDSVAPGITAMAAFGHTPGHMTFMLESAGESLLIFADTANHYVWSLAYPDWQVRFDMDKDAAAATRRRVLGMLAADRVPLLGYHMPFPAIGFVETRGDGFHFVPASYQMLL